MYINYNIYRVAAPPIRFYMAAPVGTAMAASAVAPAPPAVRSDEMGFNPGK